MPLGCPGGQAQGDRDCSLSTLVPRVCVFLTVPENPLTGSSSTILSNQELEKQASNCPKK